MRGQRGFFDVDDRLKRLRDLGDHSDGAQGGRPRFDHVIMSSSTASVSPFLTIAPVLRGRISTAMSQSNPVSKIGRPRSQRVRSDVSQGG